MSQLPIGDAFGRASLPPAVAAEGRGRDRFSREARLVLIAKAAEELLRIPHPATLFVGAVLQSWLQHGGSLEHLLGVVGPPRSRLTPAKLWAARCAATATRAEQTDTMDESLPSTETEDPPPR